MAIIRYICERYSNQGTPSLYGVTPTDKAQVEQWLEVESQIFQPVLRSLVKQPLRLRGEQAIKELVAEQTEKLGNVLDVYEAHLSKRKYLAGEFVSIADLSICP